MRKSLFQCCKFSSLLPKGQFPPRMLKCQREVGEVVVPDVLLENCRDALGDYNEAYLIMLRTGLLNKVDISGLTICDGHRKKVRYIYFI